MGDSKLGAYPKLFSPLAPPQTWILNDKQCTMTLSLSMDNSITSTAKVGTATK